MDEEAAAPGAVNRALTLARRRQTRASHKSGKQIERRVPNILIRLWPRGGRRAWESLPGQQGKLAPNRSRDGLDGENLSLFRHQQKSCVAGKKKTVPDGRGELVAIFLCAVESRKSAPFPASTVGEATEATDLDN